MQTVVETPTYVVDAERLFADAERAEIADLVASDPVAVLSSPERAACANYASDSVDAARAVAHG
jgi:hypothetical protein